MRPHPLTNFEIQKYYQNKPRFNSVYSRDNLPEYSSTEIKDGVYITNLGEYSDIGTHWVTLYVQNNDVSYFNFFGVEHIPKDIRRFIDNENIKANIFRTQGNNSIICGYFCIESIDSMLAGKILTDFSNLFSPKSFTKSDDIILNYFMTNV